MSYKYPRERKEIVTICGYYDPFDDQTFSQAIWVLSEANHHATYHAAEEIIAAPSLTGKYAIHLKGEVQNIGANYGTMGMTPYKYKSSHGFYAPSNPLKYGVRAEFRLRIVADEPATTHDAAHSAGWWLDGNTTNFITRCFVGFNVSNQTIGISTNNSLTKNYTITSTPWTSTYDTWYDIRIDMDYDWFTDPDQVVITVYVNKTQELQFNMDRDDWRIYNAHGAPTFQGNWSILGRNGPGLEAENDGGATNGNFVEAYWTDILVTQKHRIHNWKFKDGVIQRNRRSHAEGSALTSEPISLVEGSDIQIWARNTTSDLFIGQFRGIIRQANRVRNKLYAWKAEGYMSILFGEKTEVLTETTKTTGQILADAINNPIKPEFDTSTYFDSTSVTYNRKYIFHPKMDIVEEMQFLEGFLVFPDIGNNIHFQSPRTNDSGIHLIYGQSKIRKYNGGEVFVRQPTVVRVVGTGVTAQREIASTLVTSNTISIRIIDRTDLTLQADVDDALDYYITAHMDPIKTVKVSLRSNYAVTRGNTILLTIPDLQIYAGLFLVAEVHAEYPKHRMTLQLLEAVPHISMLISDLAKRADSGAQHLYAQDTAGGATDFHVEGRAVVFIEAEYEIEFSSVVERSGKMVVTNEIIDDLIETLNEETVTQPTNLAYGTGTTAATIKDTALETETSRAAATATLEEDMGKGRMRACKYEIDVVDPSGVTELGMLNAGSGGTLACRSVFAAYTKSGTVTFRIRFRLNPQIGTCQMTSHGIYQIAAWFSSGATWALGKVGLYGQGRYIGTHPDVGPPDGNSSTYSLVPNLPTDGTFTRTKYLVKDRILFKFEYTFDSTDLIGYSTGKPEVALILSEGAAGNWQSQMSVVMKRKMILGWDDYEGYDCLWMWWVEIKRSGYVGV